MGRIGWLALLVAVAGAVVVWLLQEPRAEGPPSEPEGAGAPETPTLSGRAPPPAPIALPQVEDPVGYVLGSLGAIPEPKRRAHLRALVAADPTFLQGLIDWIASPDGRPAAPAGASTNRTVEGAVHYVLQLIGAPAIPPLVALLTEDGRRDARYGAARALAAVGPTAPEATAEAAEALVAAAAREEEDRHVRAAAVDALGALGPAGADVLPLVHATLRDPDCEEELGLACARNLVRLGGASEAVFETCRRVLAEDWHRASAILLHGLVGLGPRARPMLPDLLRLFEEPDHEEGLWGALPPVLASIGAADDDVLDLLAGMVRDAREQRIGDGGAAWALAHLGPRGRARLLDLHAGATPRAQLAALRLLAQTDHDRADLLARTEPLLGAATHVSRGAFALLAGLELPAADLLRTVRPFLDDDDEARRAAAVYALGYARTPTRPILETLRAQLASGSGSTASAALDTLGGLAATWPDEVLATLLESMLDERDEIARGATSALHHLLPHRRGAVLGTWLGALAVQRTRFAALSALTRHAPDDPRAKLAFRTAAEDPDPAIRRQAVFALGRAAQAEDLARVIGMTRDPDLFVRIAALRSLHAFREHDDGRGLDACLVALADARDRVRTTAAYTLSQAGARAARLLPALEDLRATYAARGYPIQPLDRAITGIRAAVRAP